MLALDTDHLADWGTRMQQLKEEKSPDFLFQAYHTIPYSHSLIQSSPLRRQIQKGACLKRVMTRAEARAFRTRWEMVNAAERAELQATPLDRKLHQLAALMASVEPLGWTEALAAEEEQVRARWNRLRATLHG